MRPRRLGAAVPCLVLLAGTLAFASSEPKFEDAFTIGPADPAGRALLPPKEAPGTPAPPSLPPPLAPDRLCIAYSLTPGVAYPVPGDSAATGTPQTHGYWTAVGMHSEPGCDWDLELFADYNGTPCPQGLLAASSYGQSYVDFVISDFNDFAANMDFQVAQHYSGTGNATVLWDSGADILEPNQVVREPFDESNFIKVWDVLLEAGQAYDFWIYGVSGGEMKLLLFENPWPGAYWAGRSARILEVEDQQNQTFTPSRTDWYGLVAVNEAGGLGEALLSFGYCTPPVALSPSAVHHGGHGFDWLSVTPTEHYWTALAFRTNAWTHRISEYGSSSGGPWPGCFGNWLGDIHYGLDDLHVLVRNYNGATLLPSWFRSETALGEIVDMQWDAGTDLYVVGDPPVYRSTNDQHLVEIWDVDLEAHQAYNFFFAPTGAAQTDLSVFSPYPDAGWRDDAGGLLTTEGGCFSHISFEDGYHGIAVANRNGESGEYEFAIEHAVRDAPPSPLDAPSAARGAAWVDFDGDGDDDLHVTSGAANANPPSRLFRNDGGSFVDVAPALLANYAGLFGRWADMDNDGDPDLLRPTPGSPPLQLLRNDGGGAFVDATPPSLSDSLWIVDAVWVDLDRDGALDIAALTRDAPDLLMFYRGDGHGDLALHATAGTIADGPAINVSCCDYDADGDPDFFVSAHLGDCLLFRNDGSGAFTDVAGSAFPYVPAAAWQSAWADIDKDLDFDLYVSHGGVANDWLWRNDGGTFTDVSSSFLPTLFGSAGSVTWADIDNDGDPDLHIAPQFDAPNLVFNNAYAGTLYANVNPVYASVPDPSGGLAYGDPDGDGDLDGFLPSLLDGAPATNHLFVNELCSGNHWLQVELEGVVSNRSAIGAKVTLYAYVERQVREIRGHGAAGSQDSRIVHFGILGFVSPDSLVIDWPSGIHQVIVNPPFNTRIYVVEEHPAIDVPVLTGTAATPFALGPPVPNPFRGSTLLRFDLPAPATASLRVFDVAGRLVRELVVAEPRGPGRHEVSWDGRNGSGRRVPSGIYFYRLEAGGLEATRKVIRVH